MDLITPNASSSGGPLKRKPAAIFQPYFLDAKTFQLASLTGGLIFAFAPGPLKSLGGSALNSNINLSLVANRSNTFSEQTA